MPFKAGNKNFMQNRNSCTKYYLKSFIGTIFTVLNYKLQYYKNKKVTMRVGTTMNINFVVIPTLCMI